MQKGLLGEKAVLTWQKEFLEETSLLAKRLRLDRDKLDEFENVQKSILRTLTRIEEKLEYIEKCEIDRQTEVLKC